MEYRKHLTEKFRKYQSILGDLADECDEGKIDLTAISRDLCCIDEAGRINIERIPLKDDYVYFTVYPREEDIIVPLSQVCDSQLQYLVEVMRKAMIIEELRNTYSHETSGQ